MNREPQTLFEHVARRARVAPDSIALRGAFGQVSYATLARRASRFAAGLAARSLGRGDVIALQMPNTPEFVVALLGAVAVGATVQMVHMPYRRAELSFLLAHSGARAYLGLARFRDASPAQTVVALREAGQLERMHRVVALGEAIAGAEPWSAIADGEPATGLPDVAADEPYVLLYTSGTTANPKGVPTSARRFLVNAADAVAELLIVRDDVLLTAAPFTHLYGLFVLEAAFVAGAGLSLLPAFTPADFVETVRRDEVSAIFAGPAHFKPLLDQGAMRRDDFARVRFACLSGTIVPPPLARAVEEHLPAGEVIQLWGMSELQAGAYGRPHDPPDVRHETAGCASPRTELRVVDDAGEVLPANTDGRLQVRGPSVFAGYLDNAGATAAAFDGDWFDTGDTARLRRDGALVITGRVKELINRGGVKFNPADVEPLLEAVPGVARCVLVPITDPVLGERTCAIVQRAGGPPVTLDALTAALDAAGVAKFKWPERIEIVDEMPLTPTQKVQRAVLAAAMQQRMLG